MYPTQSVNFLANCLGKTKELFKSSKDPPTTIPQVTHCYVDVNSPKGWLILELRTRSPGRTDSANVPPEPHISDHSVDESDFHELGSPDQNDAANVPPEAHTSDHNVDESDRHELFVPCGSGAIKFLASPRYVEKILLGDPPMADFVDPSLTQSSAYRDECTIQLPRDGNLVSRDVRLRWCQRGSQKNDADSDLPAFPVEDSGVTQYLIFKKFDYGQAKIDLRFRRSVQNGATGALGQSSARAGNVETFKLSLPCIYGKIEFVVTPDSVRKLLNGDLSMVRLVRLPVPDMHTRSEECTVNMSYTGVSISCDVLLQWREYSRPMVDLESQQEKFCWWDFVAFRIRDALEQPTISALALRLVGGWIFMRPRKGMVRVYFCLGLWIFSYFVSLLSVLFFVFWKDRATRALYLLILIPTGVMAICFILKCILISCKRISTMGCCILEVLSVMSFVLLFILWIIILSSKNSLDKHEVLFSPRT